MQVIEKKKRSKIAKQKSNQVSDQLFYNIMLNFDKGLPNHGQPTDWSKLREGKNKTMSKLAYNERKSGRTHFL